MTYNDTKAFNAAGSVKMPGIFNRLAERIGLDPPVLGQSAWRSAIRRRRSALRLTGEAEYAERLSRDTAEFDALIDELVVPESWFYRDATPFAEVRQRARRWLVQGHARPFRVLSLACARGEEPYSLAMTLIDAGLPSQAFTITAVDISQRVLDYARRGVYSEAAFRELPEPLKRRFTRPEQGGRRVTDEVRQSVRLVRANLLELDDLIPDSSAEVVFCRNVLIYLTAEARRRVLSQLERVCIREGLIVVGRAEQSNLALKAIPSTAMVGQSRAPARSAGRISLPFPTIPSASPPRSPIAHVSRQRDRDKQSTIPAPISTGNIDDGAEIDRAITLADRGDYPDAQRIGEAIIDREPTNAQAHELLGQIAMAQQEYDQAEALFAKAVYLDPDQPDALLALSLLARRRGDGRAANAHERRRRRALTRRDDA